MLVKTYGSAVYGVDAATITAEISVETGKAYLLVGLPDNAVKESQYRIETAIKHIDYHWPRRKIVINLSPADLRNVSEGVYFVKVLDSKSSNTLKVVKE